MKVYYQYKKYPHSKQATEWSHLANLLLSFACFALLPCVFFLFIAPSSESILAIGSIILYIFLYITKITPAIEEQANKDYIAQFGRSSAIVQQQELTPEKKISSQLSNTQPTVSEEIKYCRICGSSIINGAIFCAKCGTKL